MNIDSIMSKVLGFCEENENPELVVKYSRYFKEGYDAYGLNTELTHSLSDMIFGSFDFDFATFKELSYELMKSSKYELPVLAILIMKKLNNVDKRDCFNLISEWYDFSVNNWAHNDVICSEFLSLYLKDKVISLNDLDSWKKSERPFKRRAVPVAMLKVISEDNSKLLDYIEDMMTDSERVVHQGLGWLLREMWKKNNAQTEEFLLKYKNISARLIFQYACEKMSKEEKLKFKKTKD